MKKLLLVIFLLLMSFQCLLAEEILLPKDKALYILTYERMQGQRDEVWKREEYSNLYGVSFVNNYYTIYQLGMNDSEGSILKSIYDFHFRVPIDVREFLSLGPEYYEQGKILLFKDYLYNLYYIFMDTPWETEKMNIRYTGKTFFLEKDNNLFIGKELIDDTITLLNTDTKEEHIYENNMKSSDEHLVYLFDFQEKEREIISGVDFSPEILYNTDKLTIAVDGQVLYYLPKRNGKIEIENKQVLYEDKGGNIFNQNIDIEYYFKKIDGVFFGPEEIPEEILDARADELNKRGEMAFQDDEKIKARDIFKEALKLTPERTGIIHNLGKVYFRMNSYMDTSEETINTFQKLIELTDDESTKEESYYKIAQTYEKKEDWWKALEQYQYAQ